MMTPHVSGMPKKNDARRRCALALHALHASDREWLLGRLEPEHQGVLRSFVAELHELGIRPDRSVSLAMLADEDQPLPAQVPITSRARIGETTTDQLRALLAYEAPGVVFEALSCLHSVKRNAFLGSLEDDARRQLEEWTRARDPHHLADEGNLMRQAVLDELAARLMPSGADRDQSIVQRVQRRWRAARRAWRGERP